MYWLKTPEGEAMPYYGASGNRDRYATSCRAAARSKPGLEVSRGIVTAHTSTVAQHPKLRSLPAVTAQRWVIGI